MATTAAKPKRRASQQAGRVTSCDSASTLSVVSSHNTRPHADVFNHRNESLRAFLLSEYFFGKTGGGSPLIQGFYVDGAFERGCGCSRRKAGARGEQLAALDQRAMCKTWLDRRGAGRGQVRCRP